MEETKEEIQIEQVKSMQEKLLDASETSICNILDQEISTDNLDLLSKLVDIHKDISNEIYWKIKESEIMRYNNYGTYDNYGRYNDYGRYNEYGRRGVDAKYRGHEYMDRMYDGYNRYEDGREQYNRGNYNAKDDTIRSLQYMLESTMDFFRMLKSEAQSQEEVQMIRQTAQRIAQM